MKISFIFFLLVCLCKTGIAQLINTQPVDISAGPINFNAPIIKQNKIKKIIVAIVDKPDGEVITDKGAGQGYVFDTTGKLTSYYYTVLNHTQVQEMDVPAIKKQGRLIKQSGTHTTSKYINDTILAHVFYDSMNRIITKRIKMGDYVNAHYYEYDSTGHLSKEIYCRETNVSENRNEFKLGVQKILSTETFKYTWLTPTQLKKSCLNDEGREYKKVIINYDDKGNKQSENYDFIVSWMHQEHVFQYDSNGRLHKKAYVGNESGELKGYSIYEYNATGTLLSEQQFKNDVLSFEINYLYDETFNLLKSKVSRNHTKASIEIAKYTFEFY